MKASILTDRWWSIYLRSQKQCGLILSLHMTSCEPQSLWDAYNKSRLLRGASTRFDVNVLPGYELKFIEPSSPLAHTNAHPPSHTHTPRSVDICQSYSKLKSMAIFPSKNKNEKKKFYHISIATSFALL